MRSFFKIKKIVQSDNKEIGNNVVYVFFLSGPVPIDPQTGGWGPTGE